MNLTVTTNQKPTIDTHKKTERKPNITLKKIIKPQGKRDQKKKRAEKNYKSNQKTSNKMAISTYLSIITLNVNGVNAPLNRHCIAEWIFFKKTYPYAAYKRLTSELKTHTD